MKRTDRLELTDSITDVAAKMAEGNVGAINVVCMIVKHAPEIDPQNALGGLGALFLLDSHGIYGPRIWILFKYVCKDLVTMLAVLRAVQLGLLRMSVVEKAISEEGQGEGFDVAAVVASVKAELPQFGMNETVAA